MKRKRGSVPKRSAQRRTVRVSLEDLAAPIEDNPVMRVKLGAGGRVVIPASLRRGMKASIGETLLMQVREGDLCVWTPETGLRKARELIAKHIPKNVDLVAELIAERRREAVREDRGE
jgi:bifunctional DNA-binding transcriptional regulator/antitoxin component of YhaV-PrlF toxin-antitoxin module